MAADDIRCHRMSVTFLQQPHDGFLKLLDGLGGGKVGSEKGWTR